MSTAQGIWWGGMTQDQRNIKIRSVMTMQQWMALTQPQRNSRILTFYSNRVLGGTGTVRAAVDNGIQSPGLVLLAVLAAALLVWKLA